VNSIYQVWFYDNNIQRHHNDYILFPEGFELFLLVFYSFEMVIKIIALGFVLNKNSYLRNNWNILDFLVVVSSWLPVVIHALGISNPLIDLDVLRAIRIIRPFRSIKNIKRFRQIMLALSKATRLLTDSLIL